MTMMAQKELFDIDLVMERLRSAVAPFPPAAMFQLAEEGYSSLFEQLVACIISIRTYDEVSIPVAHALFSKARTPEAMHQLTPAEIATLIAQSTFAEAKAQQIHDIAAITVAEYDGVLPCDGALLQTFKGVGPKCANLALGIACGAPAISVDIHVHRVTNRWGYVQTRTPEQTMLALEKVLPQQYWIEINRLLVPFGKHICTGTRPYCSRCPLLAMCRQVGVQASR
jgi:endonuclease-3